MAQSTTPTPTLVLRDINGRSFSLSDYKGKVLLIKFLGNVVSTVPRRDSRTTDDDCRW